MGIKGEQKDLSTQMANRDGSPTDPRHLWSSSTQDSTSSSNSDNVPNTSSSNTHNLPASTSAPANHNGATMTHSQTCPSFNTPDQAQRPLTSGPRPHGSSSLDRPSSAPPHQLERLSGAILRSLGDQYQNRSMGKSWQFLGDQLEFESQVRRALSYPSLSSLNKDDNT